MIYLLANSWWRNGTTTFTRHLYAGLHQLGEEVKIVRPSTRSAKTTRGFEFMTWEQIMDSDAEIIVCTFKRNQNNVKLNQMIVEKRAVVVFHNLAELDFGHVFGYRPVAVRKTLAAAMGCDSTYIPHPYARSCSVIKKNRNFWAVNISRVARGKNTEMILQANQKLSKKKRIQIFGIEDRLYSYYVLEKKYPGVWKCGDSSEFEPATGQDICAKATWMVDPSVIRNDGGGTQYTYLEAMDGRAGIVLHKEWLSHRSVFKPGVNCYAVETADELAACVRKSPDTAVLDSAENILRRHDAKKIAKKYLEQFS